MGIYLNTKPGPLVGSSGMQLGRAIKQEATWKEANDKIKKEKTAETQSASPKTKPTTSKAKSSKAMKGKGKGKGKAPATDDDGVDN